MKKLVMLLTVLLLAGTVLAAPSLQITKPPVTPVPSYSGPINDTHAIQGQWFKHINPTTGTVGEIENRTHEFYDNKEGDGGGFKSTFAIEGYGGGFQYNTAGNLTGFNILATITNDTPGIGPWRDGTNSHGEALSTPEQYVGTLYDTKLTVEFAIDAAALNAWDPQGTKMGTGPYKDMEPHIVAVDHDELGWYCWTPGNPDQEKTPWGDYLVPTYDFGDIAQGASITKTLNFVIDGAGLVEGDARREAIESGLDIFLNRTTSLKISNWIEMLAIDDGTPYPKDDNGVADLNSDVSVFHNIPEPMTICLLGLGALSLRKKRKA